MEQQKDWTEQLRSRLENHQAAVPDGLWDSIAAAMDAQEAQQRKARVLVMRRRIAVAASVAAIVIGGAVFYHFQSSPSADGKLPMARVFKSQTTNWEQSSETPSLKEQLFASALPVSGKTWNATGKSWTANEKTADRAEQTNLSDKANLLENQINTIEPASGNVATESHPQSSSASATSEQQQRGTDIAPQRPFVGERSGTIRRNGVSSSRFTLALAASGKFPSINSSGDMSSADAVVMAGPLLSYVANDVVSATPKSAVKKHHALPFTLGVSVGYALTDRLSLSSGVTYTRLSSDFETTVGSHTATDTQTLQYIGVPLKAHYTLWQNRHLKVYATAGGQADFNISAKMDYGTGDTDIDKDRVQFSVNASAGAEYDIVPEVGIFVEPGLRYYIDNGSKVENLFKDKPCNFDLQLGIRFNIK